MRGMKKKEKMARNVFPYFDTDKSQLGCFVLKNIFILLSFSHCFEMLYFFLAFLIKLSCAPSGRHGNLTGLEGEYLYVAKLVEVPCHVDEFGSPHQKLPTVEKKQTKKNGKGK